MSLKFALPLALTALSLSAAGTASATTYTEIGDAGDLPATAQIITVPVGNSTTTATLTTLIAGATTLTNGVSDSDMYQLTIPAASTFTVSTNFFSPGTNNFDTQIALFSAAGVGIIANDDAASGGSLSTFTVSLAAGTYDLLISGSGRYAVDSTGALIFPNYTDGTTDPSGTYSATSARPIAGYTGSSNEGGNYRISLSAVANVPEPSTVAAVAVGLGGLGLVLRRRA